MANKILFKNESKIYERLRDLDRAIEKINPLLKEVNSLVVSDEIKTPKIIDIVDIKSLIEHGSRYFKEYVIKSQPPKPWNGIQTNPAILMDLLLWPDFTIVDSLVEECKPYLELLRYLTVKDNMVIVAPRERQEIEDMFTIYANTKEGLRILAAFEKIDEGMGEFNNALIGFTGAGLFPEQPLSRYFQFINNKYQGRNLYFFETNRQRKDGE